MRGREIRGLLLRMLLLLMLHSHSHIAKATRLGQELRMGANDPSEVHEQKGSFAGLDGGGEGRGLVKARGQHGQDALEVLFGLPVGDFRELVLECHGDTHVGERVGELILVRFECAGRGFRDFLLGLAAAASLVRDDGPWLLLLPPLGLVMLLLLSEVLEELSPQEVLNLIPCAAYLVSAMEQRW